MVRSVQFYIFQPGHPQLGTMLQRLIGEEISLVTGSRSGRIRFGRSSPMNFMS
jgi:hypothetical protein